jgi:hypothetical protein
MSELDDPYYYDDIEHCEVCGGMCVAPEHTPPPGIKRFTVTIVETVTQYRSKVFRAATEEDARDRAESDNSWSDQDGWENDEAREHIDCGIEEVEEVED